MRLPLSVTIPAPVMINFRKRWSRGRYSSVTAKSYFSFCERNGCLRPHCPGTVLTMLGQQTKNVVVTHWCQYIRSCKKEWKYRLMWLLEDTTPSAGANILIGNLFIKNKLHSFWRNECSYDGTESHSTADAQKCHVLTRHKKICQATLREFFQA